MCCRRVQVERTIFVHLRGDGGKNALPVGLHDLNSLMQGGYDVQVAREQWSDGLLLSVVPS